MPVQGGELVIGKIRGIYLPGDVAIALEELRDLARQNEARSVTDDVRRRWAGAAEAIQEAVVEIMVAEAVKRWPSQNIRRAG